MARSRHPLRERLNELSQSDAEKESSHRPTEESVGRSESTGDARHAAPAAGEVGPLRVTGMASGGEGVGRMEDGRVVFVEGGVPGDLVELSGWTLRKKVARAGIGRLIESSPDRVEARCEHFGRCGGCRWQHIRYEAQLDAKRVMVRNALERIGGFESLPDFEIIASPDPYGYRARARLVQSKDGIGYRIRGSREIEAIKSCPVLTPSAQETLSGLLGAEVARAPGREEASPTEPTEQIERNGPTRSKRKKGSPQEWIVSGGSTGSAIVQEVRDQSKGQGASEFVTIEVLGEKLRVGSKSFMQGNALLWDALAGEVCRQFAIGDDDASDTSSTQGKGRRASFKRFVELYAGIGFLTLPLARLGYRGVAIESDRSALADLACNLAQGGLTKQVEIVRGRVETRRDLAKRFAVAGRLLLDPPRTGLEAKVRDVIAADGPSRVVYVSCDPATLARDLRVLAAGGYRLSSVTAMDLFPQTPHVEVIVRLDRESGGPAPRRSK